MDEADRLLLQRHRRLLVEELRVDQLWDALLSRELFKPHMIEDIQQAGCGSRRDQARQLITDLESLGSEALPLFISCLEETGQYMLASILQTNRQTEKFLIPKPKYPRPVDIGSGGFGDDGAPDNLRGSADLAYVMSTELCGHCLIINNVNFSLESRLSTRTCSNINCGKLQLRFSLLHFMVEVKRDLTAKEMRLTLLELARQDHGALDCCVVVICCQASHLQFLRAVYGTDGYPVSVEKIVNIFNGTSCPSLGGKPKLFFIQACGGEQKDHGFEVASTSPQEESLGSNPESDATPFQEDAWTFDQVDAVSSLPTPNDIFVSYSTFPGFVSWRERKSGSWYVETLDDIFEQWAHSEDLQSLLLRVANAVSGKGIYKQMPGFFNFLRKKLFKTS
ncbi:Caspase-9 [Saguinus oedipus]|uniref:Caspase-9 n=1 Tax=Saguinus oedipus TaxID=9490 RepID=A0ABQ9UCU2_SAGOE|nr:Caspase-9 [Saguinus oedipus]